MTDNGTYPCELSPTGLCDRVGCSDTCQRRWGPGNDNAGPFSLGQDIWPGLAKLAEECGEVVQVIGKLVATGGQTEHWSGLDLGLALEEEMGDVMAAIAFVVNYNLGVDSLAVSARADQKLALFERWHG